LSSRDEIRKSIRQLRHTRGLTQLQRRPSSELPFVDHAKPLPHLLLDSTVYIDQLQGSMPASLKIDPQSTHIWHSTVTESELLAAAGLLDPRHPATASAIQELVDTIERRREHRILNPDRADWRDAGILTGTLARLQHYGKADQRRVLNDALILLSATKAGLTVLTRNIADYDLLLQLVPRGKAVFYEREPSV
jgi:predicted nucleic acid-binding protein